MARRCRSICHEAIIESWLKSPISTCRVHSNSSARAALELDRHIAIIHCKPWLVAMGLAKRLALLGVGDGGIDAPWPRPIDAAATVGRLR
jgi:hypothetical protein